MTVAVIATSSIVALALAITLVIPQGWHSAQIDGLQNYKFGLWRVEVSAVQPVTPIETADETPNTEEDANAASMLEQRCKPGLRAVKCGTWNILSARNLACASGSDPNWCDFWTRMAASSISMFICGMNSVFLLGMGAFNIASLSKQQSVARKRSLTFFLLAAVFDFLGLFFYWLSSAFGKGDLLLWSSYGIAFWISLLLAIVSFAPWILTKQSPASPDTSQKQDWGNMTNEPLVMQGTGSGNSPGGRQMAAASLQAHDPEAMARLERSRQKVELPTWGMAQMKDGKTLLPRGTTKDFA